MEYTVAFWLGSNKYYQELQQKRKVAQSQIGIFGFSTSSGHF